MNESSCRFYVRVEKYQLHLLKMKNYKEQEVNEEYRRMPVTLQPNWLMTFSSDPKNPSITKTQPRCASFANLSILSVSKYRNNYFWTVLSVLTRVLQKHFLTWYVGLTTFTTKDPVSLFSSYHTSAGIKKYSIARNKLP